MSEQRIGQFVFLILDGQISPPGARIEAFVRPGIDGVGFQDLGRHPEPFTLRSKVDQPSFALARDEFDRYVELQAADAVLLTKDGLPSTNAVRPFLVKVIDVRLVVCRALLAIVGGLNYPSLAWLEADWKLVAVEI